MRHLVWNQGKRKVYSISGNQIVAIKFKDSKDALVGSNKHELLIQIISERVSASWEKQNHER